MMTASIPAMDAAARQRCFREGRELFHARRYFDCHEVWEDLWRQSAGPEKLLLQGLIQAAVGGHHWQRGNAVGARCVWERSLRNLRAAAPLLGLEPAVHEVQTGLETCLQLPEGAEMPRLQLVLETLSSEVESGLPDS